jgi:uncharacterized repeat protein (TIGR01451 family)
MKTSIFLRSALLSTALVGLAGAAPAAGTIPGVSISNSIDLSYETSADDTITLDDAANATFVVDRKIDFTLVGQDAGNNVNVEQDDERFLTFRLENEGNDTSGYDIDVASGGAIGLVYDADGTPVSGEYDVLIGTDPNDDSTFVRYDPNGIVNIGDIAADGVVYVRIVGYVPSNALDGQTQPFQVTAVPLLAGTATPTTEVTGQGAGAVDTVFADDGEDGTETDTEQFTVTAPNLTAAKTALVVSENRDGSFNCASGAIVTEANGNTGAAIPGACVEYTISVSNGDGTTTAATNMTITDDLPAEVTYSSIIDIVGFDSVTQSGGTVTATIATLAADAAASFKVRAVID